MSAPPAAPSVSVTGSAKGDPALAGAHPPGRARALDALTFVAVAGALVLVGIAAAPAVLRTATTTAPNVGEASPVGPLRPPGFRGDGMTPAPHRSFVTSNDDDEDDPLAQLEKMRPALPGDADLEERLHERPAEHDAELGQVDKGSAQVRFGTARNNVFLLAEPGDVTHTRGVVHAKERVMIVKENGDWVQVIHGGPESGGEMGMGWVKKSEIAIR